MSGILYREESYALMGACFEVYKLKGSGFTEPVYQECLKIELELLRIPFVAQPILELEYKGVVLEQTFRPDFVCFDKIVVEIKALERLADVHRAQSLNYLNATQYDLAILVNFGHFPKLEYERLANDRNRGTRSNLHGRLAERDDFKF
ncbi:MAG: GxxExxY protein [Pyrinomonadaceae bacterium]